MANFLLGIYSTITILGLTALLVIFLNAGRRISTGEKLLSIIAAVCWPLLALAVSLAVLIKRVSR